MWNVDLNGVREVEPETHTLYCTGCNFAYLLPVSEWNGLKSIPAEPLTGWTAPPPLCPQCSENAPQHA